MNEFVTTTNPNQKKGLAVIGGILAVLLIAGALFVAFGTPAGQDNVPAADGSRTEAPTEDTPRDEALADRPDYTDQVNEFPEVRNANGEVAFTAEQTQAAALVAYDMLGLGLANADLIDATKESDQALVDQIAPYLDAELRDSLLTGTPEARAAIERLVLDTYNAEGIEINGIAVGATFANENAWVDGGTGWLVIETTVSVTVDTNSGPVVNSRTVNLLMAEAPGTQYGWLVNNYNVVMGE